MTASLERETDVEAAAVPARVLAVPRRMRLVRRFAKDRAAMIALILFLLLILVAVFASVVAPFDPNKQQLSGRLQGPSTTHWLGTDEFGRDQLSRLIYGARSSLFASFIAIIVGGVIGTPLGLLAGYFGRWVDSALSRLNDALMSVPALILALTVVAVLGPGLTNAMLAVGIIFIPRFFRVVRGATQDIRHETFVEASNAIGCTGTRTLWRHVFPNILSPLAVQVSLGLGAAVTAEASLSFLGLGVRPPTASWGGMLSSAAANITKAPYLVLEPGVMIALTVLALTFMGDGLRRALGTRRMVAEGV
jgi:peptide/nickel transport system permease protein